MDVWSCCSLRLTSSPSQIPGGSFYQCSASANVAPLQEGSEDAEGAHHPVRHHTRTPPSRRRAEQALRGIRKSTTQKAPLKRRHQRRTGENQLALQPHEPRRGWALLTSSSPKSVAVSLSANVPFCERTADLSPGVASSTDSWLPGGGSASPFSVRICQSVQSMHHCERRLAHIAIDVDWVGIYSPSSQSV
jgi:hypothetical protein